MGVARSSWAENGPALAKIWASGVGGDSLAGAAWGYWGWTLGDNRERSTAIPQDVLRKEGRNPGEVACAFIYVSNFIKREGAGSTQGQSCPGRRRMAGRPEFTQQRF